jgi:hypothetical protein
VVYMLKDGLPTRELLVCRGIIDSNAGNFYGLGGRDLLCELFGVIF